MTLEAKALCAVNLLTLPLDLVDFFVERPRPILESISTSRSMPVEHEVLPPEVTTSSASSSYASESFYRSWCLFLAALSASWANQAARAISASAYMVISYAFWLGDSPSPP
jgi:hypothetical protein